MLLVELDTRVLVIYYCVLVHSSVTNRVPMLVVHIL